MFKSYDKLVNEFIKWLNTIKSNMIGTHYYKWGILYMRKWSKNRVTIFPLDYIKKK
jgi:hypothetical protein